MHRFVQRAFLVVALVSAVTLAGCSMAIDPSYFLGIQEEVEEQFGASYLLPVPDALPIYTIQGNFGEFSHRPEYGGQYAWDFVTQEEAGFEVLAARGGVVRAVHTDSDTVCSDLNVRADGTPLPNCWTYANFVLLDHGNDESSLYLHLAAGTVTVAAGEVVQRGQLLGIAGTTGWSTLIHLHFQVEETPCLMSDEAVRAQCEGVPGWWWTASLPIAFDDADVRAKHPDGIPTSDPATNPYRSDNISVS
jgi:murein DD-endopeptidase MepM/ murein hydrolase activator NlpD